MISFLYIGGPPLNKIIGVGNASCPLQLPPRMDGGCNKYLNEQRGEPT